MAQSRLTEEERHKISTLLASGNYSLRNIAEIMNRAPSTISREVKKYTIDGVYNPEKAHEETIKQRVNQGRSGYVIEGRIKELVDTLLAENLSPEKVSERLLKEHSISVHYSTIYRYIRRSK